MHPDGSQIPVVWWSGTEEKGVYLEGFLSGRCCSTNQEHLSTSFGAPVGFPSVVTSCVGLRASRVSLGLLWCLGKCGVVPRGVASSRQAACLSLGAPTDFLLCCRFRLHCGEVILVIERWCSGCQNTRIAVCASGLLGYSEDKKNVTVAQSGCLAGGSAASPQKALPPELLQKRGCAS